MQKSIIARGGGGEGEGENERRRGERKGVSTGRN